MIQTNPNEIKASGLHWKIASTKEIMAQVEQVKDTKLQSNEVHMRNAVAKEGPKFIY